MTHVPWRSGAMAGFRALPRMLSKILKGKHTNLAQSSHLSVHKPREGLVQNVTQSYTFLRFLS